eukprot:TRINITY_DN10810_c0_g1_i5.p1 TRINITY_DN10810_c0_g1~~TRINITY_DN10810_c0_g1_i5.p1  ORF type:complete len:841 (-),score=327.64 TRINITY_DN10810_c0_g1_i5:70-2565(-)
MAQTGVIKSLAELMRWAGGVAVVKGKGDCKEEVDLDREDQESRLNLYKAGLTLEQIESKVDLINSGLTITKAINDKVELHVPEGGEFVEIENEAEVETSYPTYVVDQDTGEILIVEQITGFGEDLGRDSPESGSKSPVDILPDHYGQNADLNSLDVQETNSESNDLKKKMIVTGDDFESCMLADVEPMPCVWQAGAEGERFVENEAQSEEEDNMEAETGPLDGQVLQIDLPEKKFCDDGGEFGDNDLMVNFEQVRFIRLEQEEQLMEEEQELEEEMLQSELETEYILEDGKLRKIDNNTPSQISNHEEEDESNGKIEKLESLVMLDEDGSAHIVVDGEEHAENIEIGDQYVLGSEDVHYVLGNEDDGNFVLHNLGEEKRTFQVQSNHANSEVINIEGDFLVQKDIEQIDENVGTLGDHLVLEHKDLEENKPVSLKQKLKEIKRRNLLLERRDGEVDNVAVLDQEVAVGDGEVIHQSELLDGGLVTGYLVLGDGDQVVLGDEQEAASEGQEMVFLEEDQIVFKDSEKSLLSKEGLEIPEEGGHLVQINESRAFDDSSVAVSRQLEGEQELTETNQYIQVVEEQTELTPGSEQLSCTAHPLSRVVGGWSELGGHDQEYDRKFVSKPRVETSGRISQGTVVCQWTKMPGDRVRVAHSKVIRPRVGQQEQGDMLDMNSLQTSSAFTETIIPPAGDISAPLLYSSLGSVWRDVGCQVTPHRVNGLPTDREEEQRQVDRIKQFLGCGGVLDRSCPGCGKVMSRQRNLVTHLKVLHGVEVQGPEREEHIARYSKENVRVECDICSKTISRKSIRRHVNLCHPSAVSVSRFTKDKSKTH